MCAETKRISGCARAGRLMLGSPVVAFAIVALWGSSSALAQAVWRLDSSSFYGYTEAYADDFDPGNPFTPCWDIDEQTQMIPGMFNKSSGGSANAKCPAMVFTCPLEAFGDVYFWVDGIGGSVVEIHWDAISEGYHNCELVPYQAWGIADLVGDLVLQIDGGSPGSPVLVQYWWGQFSFNNLKHEAFFEDPAAVRDGMLRLMGDDLFYRDFDLDNIRGILRYETDGAFYQLDGDLVDFHVEALTDAMINDPGQGAFMEDDAQTVFSGSMILSLIGPPPLPPRAELEFSLDIGSDTEESDNRQDGDEVFDPGDAYLWHGPAISPPGAQGIKDDAWIFGSDPFPDPWSAMPTGAPTCDATLSPADVMTAYFDLDGHDTLSFSLIDLLDPPPTDPITRFPSDCVTEPRFLVISYDDDSGGYYLGDPYGGCEIPTRSQSPWLRTRGTTGGDDEIIGLNINTLTRPAGVGAQYPIEDETTLHQSLAPNPDLHEENDDDVDSLDLLYYDDPVTCNVWVFSPDHEATGADVNGNPLDPGGIYEVIATGPVLVVDPAVHLGLPDGVDIDAFEFVWTIDPGSSDYVLTLLFSVDDDDWRTPEDESGGLDSRMIYGSYLIGDHFEFLEAPLHDDVDALASWWSPLRIFGYCTTCVGDVDSDNDVDGADLQPFLNCFFGNPGATNCECADMNGDNDVDMDDVYMLVNKLVTDPDPACP